MHMPMPVPQIRMPRSTVPLPTWLATSDADVGIIDAFSRVRPDVDDVLVQTLSNSMSLPLMAKPDGRCQSRYAWLPSPAPWRAHVFYAEFDERSSWATRRTSSTSICSAQRSSYSAGPPIGSAMSIWSRLNTRVRDAASGHCTTIAWRWIRVMVQITSAWRTN